MAIEVVVFDVDGVLVRAGEFGKVLETRYGIDRVKQKTFFQGPFQDCVRGRADLRHVIGPFLDEWDWPGSVDDCLRLWFEADSTPNQDVLDEGARVKAAGYRCYVASTQEQLRSEYLRDVVGLGARYDGLFFSWQLGTTKGDDARFFERVTERIGVAPENTLFFGDVETIVATARAAGWTAEVYEFGDELNEMLARHDVGTPD